MQSERSVAPTLADTLLFEAGVVWNAVIAKTEYCKIISAYAVDPEVTDVRELKDELVVVTKLIEDGPDR